MVADKEFYYSTYHGKLPQTDVEGCLARAEYMLHSLTLDRLQDGCLLYTSISPRTSSTIV